MMQLVARWMARWVIFVRCCNVMSSGWGLRLTYYLGDHLGKTVGVLLLALLLSQFDRI